MWGIEMDEIDHEFTDQITCPFCGVEDGDSWECLPNETDLGYIECYNCGRTFSAIREVSVTYTTYEIDWLEEWKRMNDRTVRQHEADERYELWVANGRPMSDIGGDARTPQH